MNLKIGTVLALIVSVLAMMAVASAGLAAYEAFGRRQESEAFLKVNQISQLLLRSAGQWALERGLTNAALKSPDALPAERRVEIVKKREAADQAFREAALEDFSVGAIKEIGDTIGRMSEISSTIAAAVEEQGAATQEISRNIQHAAEGTSQVSANISDVQRGASETGSGSSQVLSAAHSLSIESNRLKLEVGKFLGVVRAA